MIKKHKTFFSLVIILLVAISSGCKTNQETATPIVVLMPTETPPSPIPATEKPDPTATSIPIPTPLPGSVVLPLDTFLHEIPWLPYDRSAAPETYFFFFNHEKPPFNNVLVRQAFVAAIDSEAIVEIVNKYSAEKKPATSLTPPETLGRDLYNEVGIKFDPDHARELLEQAGYTDPASFPTVTLLTNTRGGDTPYLHINLANGMSEMWQEHLGISVTVEYMDFGPYLDIVRSDPPEISRIGWVADYNDPDNFLRDLFETGIEHNWGHFSNSEFDDLIQRAAEITDPAERQELYIQAERILCEIEAALIPIYHGLYQLP